MQTLGNQQTIGVCFNICIDSRCLHYVYVIVTTKLCIHVDIVSYRVKSSYTLPMYGESRTIHYQTLLEFENSHSPYSKVILTKNFTRDISRITQ
mgnify:FL=1